MLTDQLNDRIVDFKIRVEKHNDTRGYTPEGERDAKAPLTEQQLNDLRNENRKLREECDEIFAEITRSSAEFKGKKPDITIDDAAGFRKKMDELETILKNMKTRLAPSLDDMRHLAAARLYATPGWQGAKKGIKTLSENIDKGWKATKGAVSAGWLAVGKAASKCCTSIAHTFIKGANAVGAFLESCRIMREAKKEAANIRDTGKAKDALDIEKKYMGYFKSAVQEITDKEKIKPFTNKGNVRTYTFVEIVRSAWNNKEGFLFEVQRMIALNRQIETVYQAYKARSDSKRLDSSHQRDKDYDSTLEVARGVAKKAQGEYREDPAKYKKTLQEQREKASTEDELKEIQQANKPA